MFVEVTPVVSFPLSHRRRGPDWSVALPREGGLPRREVSLGRH
jgi:hypothetical protein